jgi:hypothetical protein
LVVDGTHDAAKAIKPIHHVDEPRQIALELDLPVPGLKGKGGATHEPEISMERRCIELFGNARAAE